MKTPKVIFYVNAKTYKKDFIRKIRPHVRKKFKKKKEFNHVMRGLKEMIPNGLASYSREINTVSVSLESVKEDICMYANKKECEERIIKGVTMLMAHEFIHYCIHEETSKSKESFSVRKIERCIDYMTKPMVDEIKELVNESLVKKIEKLHKIIERRVSK
jgi:hypothetical protein